MSERNYRIPSDYSRYKLCRKAKKWDNLKLTSPASLAYDKAIIGGQIITDYLKGDIKDDEIIDAVCGGLSSENIGLDETVEKIARKSGQDLLRYFKSEKSYRRQFDPSRNVVVAPSLEFHIGEELFKWAPGAIAISDNSIEAIVYKMGKPKVNTRTGIKDTPESKADWFPIYCALQYAKAFMTLMVETGKIANKPYTLIGSYYYMKKTTDKKDQRDPDFFSDQGGNIVSLSEKHYYGEDEKKSELDDKFIPFLEEHEIGVEECKEEDCKYCSYRATCKFVKAPQKAEKKEVKASSKPVPTKAQQAIIDEVISGNTPAVKVIAGAGAGKTFTMKELVRALLLKGADISKILILSFTDAGVKELKERVLQVIKEESLKNEDVRAKTFNGFGFEIVKDRFADVNLKKIPDILTAEYEMQYIEDLVAETKIPGADMEAVSYGADGTTTPEILVIAKTVFDIIAAKHLDVADPDTLDDVEYALHEKVRVAGQNCQTGVIKILVDLYAEYQKRYKEEGFLTYSDQEPLMMQVLEKNPEYLDNLGYEYIIVDEFQDSNEIQMDAIRLLTQTKCFKKLVVVGDDAQAIFGFRETSPQFILNFDKYIGIPTKSMMLLDNRRSTPEILDVSNKVIGLNENRVEKDLVSTRDHGEVPVIKGFHLKDKEYSYIADEMERRNREGKSWEQMAFIAGTKNELVAMGAELSKRNIPWVMKNPMNLLENSNVQAALALSDAFYDPETTENYFTYLSAKYAGKLMEKPVEEVEALIDVIRNVFLEIENEEMDTQKAIFHGYLEQLRTEEGEDELYDYFLELLYKNPDFPSELRYTRVFKKYGAKMAKKMDQDYVGVVLTTAHSSKGLEWDVVFNSITAYDYPKFHQNPNKRKPEIEEKRRLLHVSLTRARDVLYITGQYRTNKSTEKEPLYNMFLREIYDILGEPYDSTDYEKEARQAEAKKRQSEKAKERRAKQKAASSASREMTEEEKEAYDKMVLGACQTSLF